MGKTKRQLSLDWLEFHTLWPHRSMNVSAMPRSSLMMQRKFWIFKIIETVFFLLPAFVAMCWLYWTERDGTVLFITILLGFFLVVNLLGVWKRRPDFRKRVKTSEDDM